MKWPFSLNIRVLNLPLWWSSSMQFWGFIRVQAAVQGGSAGHSGFRDRLSVCELILKRTHIFRPDLSATNNLTDPRTKPSVCLYLDVSINLCMCHIRALRYIFYCLCVWQRPSSIVIIIAGCQNGCRQGGTAGVKGRRETEVPDHIDLSSLHHSTPSGSGQCRGIDSKVMTELSTGNFWGGKKWHLFGCLHLHFTAEHTQLIKAVQLLC